MTDRPTDEEITEFHLLCQSANSGTDYDVRRLGYAAREWLPRLLDDLDLALANIVRLTAANEEARARSRIEVERLADAVVAEACEMTSQDSHPDTLTITAEELHTLIVARFDCLWARPAP